MFASRRTAKEVWDLDYWLSLFRQQGNSSDWARTVFERYCRLFGLTEESFQGQIVIDVGCGPLGSLHYFKAKAKFGVDILAKYFSFFPISEHDMIYLGCPAEELPFLDNFADVVLTVNALDHVYNFEQAIREIHRVLKPGGRLLAEINLRGRPTLSEPQVISEKRVMQALQGLFEYTIIGRAPPTEYVDAESITLEARRLPAEPSPYAQLTKQISDMARASDEDLYERGLYYVSTLGAPRRIAAEYYIGSAFRHYKKGEHRAARSRIVRGILADPTWLLNRGVLSVFAEVTLGTAIAKRLRKMGKILLPGRGDR